MVCDTTMFSSAAGGVENPDTPLAPRLLFVENQDVSIRLSVCIRDLARQRQDFPVTRNRTGRGTFLAAFIKTAVTVLPLTRFSDP